MPGDVPLVEEVKASKQEQERRSFANTTRPPADKEIAVNGGHGAKLLYHGLNTVMFEYIEGRGSGYGIYPRTHIFEDGNVSNGGEPGRGHGHGKCGNKEGPSNKGGIEYIKPDSAQQVFGYIYGHDGPQDRRPIGNPGRNYIRQQEPCNDGTSVSDCDGAMEDLLGDGLGGHTGPHTYQCDNEGLEAEDKDRKYKGREEAADNSPHDPFHRLPTLHVGRDRDHP